MKTVVVLLFCAIRCLWATYLTDESRTLLKSENEKVMAILAEYKHNGFPDHDFFSNTNAARGGSARFKTDHDVTQDSHKETKHIQFLNQMAHGLVDILEQRSGALAVQLNRLNFTGTTAKKYRQDWDHSKRFTGDCHALVKVGLNYVISRHNMTHIKDCIAQGVLRMAKEPEAYLEHLFNFIESNGMCKPDTPKPVCEVGNTYTITSDLGNYTTLFENAPQLGLIPLEQLTAEKSMIIECVDERLSFVRIRYDTFQTCNATELSDDY